MVPLLDSREVQYVVLDGQGAAYSLTVCRGFNKVRIIALYIQFRDGVPDEDRRRLYQHARLSLPEQDAVNALVHLGLRISRVSPAYDTAKSVLISLSGAGSNR